MKTYTEQIYRIIDSFLVESKNQHGEERSIERLNADRHLAVEAFEKLLESVWTEAQRAKAEEINSIEPRYGKGDEDGYYAQGALDMKKDILANLEK